MAFARFADHSGHRGPLSCRMIWTGLKARYRSPNTLPGRGGWKLFDLLPNIRARFDPRTEVPDARLFGKGHRRLTPHIYTDQEIVDLLQAAREMAPQGTLRPATSAVAVWTDRRNRAAHFGSIASAMRRNVDLAAGDVDYSGRPESPSPG